MRTQVAHFIKSHQPSGLRWFRFKTLPIFQLGGFTLPPTPFPGLWFEGIAGCNRTFIRCSFRAPFFSPLGTPQNRYHKLFRLQSDPILRSKTGSKTSSHFGTGFFSNFSRFSYFSIPPQVPPVKRLPYPNHIFASLAFCSFSCLFGLLFNEFSVTKWVPKRTPKRNPKLDPSKSCVPPKEKSRVPKRGPKWYPKRGGPVKGSPLPCYVVVFC